MSNAAIEFGETVLIALQTILLDGTQVDDLEPLRDLTGLQWLGLSGTNVKDLEPLEGLGRLRRLDLSGTKIVNVAPIEFLPALQTLSLPSSLPDGERQRPNRIRQDLRLPPAMQLDFDPKQ
ncbi:MAG TPA: hypothetical protein VME41_18260 [Stellaceae bacterium]|nr:hypothetical protein [Stellaceae bacterium]